MKKLLRKLLPRSAFRMIKLLWREARYQVKSLIIRTKIMLSLPLKPKRTKIRQVLQQLFMHSGAGVRGH